VEILAENNKMEENRPALLLPVVQVLRGVARQMIGFFMLSKEDQLKTGIYQGGEGRDNQTGQ
jgi:hypothetical protein